MRTVSVLVYVCIVIAALGASPASADRQHDYGVCYQRIEKSLEAVQISFENHQAESASKSARG